jgi:hypothetical protein
MSFIALSRSTGIVRPAAPARGGAPVMAGMERMPDQRPITL